MITQELAIMFGIIAIIFAAVICILLKKGVKKTALVCIFIAYITAVVCIVFFPIPYDEEPIEYLNGYTWYNFVPFAMITEALSNGFGETAFLQIFGNILLSVPFGFFVMMWMKKPKLWKMFVFAFAFTVTIEVTQMFLGFAIHSMYRNVDIDDIILNATGAFIGFGLYKILPQSFKQKLTA
nr:VanZ family protein [uncultured Ruminococcus sp.]